MKFVLIVLHISKKVAKYVQYLADHKISLEEFMEFMYHDVAWTCLWSLVRGFQHPGSTCCSPFSTLEVRMVVGSSKMVVPMYQTAC
jgi:hypothetical protein